VRPQKAAASSQSTGGVASSLAARKTGKKSKCLRRLLGSGMTCTRQPSLSSRRSFRLVDLTISFTIEHLAIFSKLIHCIATCIANGAAARNSGATVQTSPTTTSLRVTSWSSGAFLIIRVFQFLHFHSFSCSLIDVGCSYTRLQSLTVERARWHAQR
jgi:hypothetical protein